MWYVMLFTKENSVSAVPTSWYCEKSGECFWPPATFKASEFNKYVKDRCVPDEDWQSYPASILSCSGTYLEAMTKVIKARDSNKQTLSSTTENETETKKRKRQRTSATKYKDFENSDASNGDIESDEDPQMSFPTIPINLRTEIQENSRTRTNNDRSCSNKGQRQTFFRTRSGSLSPRLLMDSDTPNYRSMAETSQKETSSLPRSVPQIISCETAQGSINTQIFEFLKRSQVVNTEFQQRVERKLTIINLKITDLEKEIKQLSNNNTKELREEMDDELRNVCTLFPVNLERLTVLESALASPDTKKALAIELSLVGGKDVGDIVKRLMYKIFTNEAGVRYSWDGAKGKLKFRTLEISGVIMNAVRHNHNTSSATEADIVVGIKKWLVRCKDRMNINNKKNGSIDHEQENQ